MYRTESAIVQNRTQLRGDPGLDHQSAIRKDGDLLIDGRHSTDGVGSTTLRVPYLSPKPLGRLANVDNVQPDRDLHGTILAGRRHGFRAFTLRKGEAVRENSANGQNRE